ncbi:hypothetical protein BS47DRAFT_1389866 [Hydnum rufescens UP504]|uniref:NAD(P)-binding protein n=1 Tax=Hydnum rufescens UP504 TaxID=1448309 RepID=A0A9P6B4B4_9AGAM|nr:hypothetical protein BS47DRAFT_1389866 [Hydnum rufescens UP504]
MPSYLITGASRGLGLAMTEKLLEDPNNVVVATARDTTASGLKALEATTPKERLHLVTLDVSKEEVFPAAVAAAEAVLPNGLDYLIVNAGVDHQTLKTFGNDVDFKLFQEEFFVNAIAPAITVRSFTPLLNQGTAKKVLFMGTVLGSLTLAESVPMLADTYSVGKAAMNMVVRKYAGALKAQGSDILLISVFPVGLGFLLYGGLGLVPVTAIGQSLIEYLDKYAPDYPRTPLDESIQGTIDVLHTFTKEEHGSFVNWKHESCPW